MLNGATRAFIARHREADIRRLALQGADGDVDLVTALEQIAGWQTAQHKLPTWAMNDDIIYPPRLSMEQCSSEVTARYKLTIARRLIGDGQRDTMVDLTGGTGADFSFMARLFARALYVEHQPRLCDLARHNMAALGLDNTEVVCAEAETYLQDMDGVSMIYIDPARRNNSGRRVYAISDCSPDVGALHDKLLAKANLVMVKLSPMLDIAKTISDLPATTEVHVVATGNECKELLVVMDSDRPQAAGPMVYCVCDGLTFVYSLNEAHEAMVSVGPISEGMYLYEPCAPVMKAGCYGLLCRRYGVKAVDVNSHLFVAADDVTDFPGRRFCIEKVTRMDKQGLRTALRGIDRANITTRNFPMSADELRRRLRLKDGGDTCLFATTAAGVHLIIIARARGKYRDRV